jgi:tRNA(Arg) A34 adenosine deaminase TadA
MSKRFTIIAKCYDRKNKVISVGLNSYNKSHPIQAHFAKLAGLPEKEYLHSEIQALVRCKDRIPHKLTVERYDSEGNPAIAKPCPICAKAIKAYGVKMVEYTVHGGWDVEIL